MDDERNNEPDDKTDADMDTVYNSAYYSDCHNLKNSCNGGDNDTHGNRGDNNAYLSTCYYRNHGNYYYHCYKNHHDRDDGDDIETVAESL